MTDSPSGSPAAIKECAGSGTPSRICRFQTIPPLPFLKAAITISEEWTIERLIEKIHGTIRSEADHREFLDLLEGPNPSHRLLLELSDGSSRQPPSIRQATAPAKIETSGPCISSPQLFHRFTQEPHERHTQLDVTQTGNQRLLGNGRRFTSLPAHQLDADNLSQAPTSYRPQHDFYTGYETVPRLQNFGATHHSSTEQSFSASNADYVPTAQHTLEFPYRSSSPSEEPKPTIEELDRST
ncbi:hypothetical protein KEM48_014413, partial [Puccinia striiformis f. sp. tritici PST-130]